MRELLVTLLSLHGKGNSFHDSRSLCACALGWLDTRTRTHRTRGDCSSTTEREAAAARDRTRPYLLLLLLLCCCDCTMGTGQSADAFRRGPDAANGSDTRYNDVGIDDFELLTMVGTGAFASVWMARQRRTGKLVAVKMQDKSHIMSKGRVSAVVAERDILSTLRHPFIVRLLYAFQNYENVFLVLTWVDGGDLFTLMDELRRPFREVEARFYAAEASGASLARPRASERAGSVSARTRRSRASR